MKVVSNPGGRSIYGDCTPSLNNVDVHSVIFKRDGPTVSIKLNLNEYPTKPPKKWEVQKFNTVQIVLSFLGVKSINMSGWVYTNYSMNLVVSRKNELISLSAKKDDFEINLESGFVDIDSISAYLK
ncbi:hypothetical protein D8B20_02815 [Candidatus Pantoea soli]|uniref:Immunity protein 50 n=1 Tax=Candidatus Pantoea soli TaxID=3098669 RepID=A0A518X9L5_9GAMM|nr:hypothetical protein D8B20_02815 [Pantoea soli]